VQRDAQAQPSLLVHALEDKLERTLDRIYRLLGLIYPWKDVAAARYTIEYSHGRTRAGAIEYLDNLLGGAVRKHVMPIIEDSSMEEKVRCANLVLRSRPRNLEDTLAQLVHDSDPVVAASAIHFVEQRQLWSLSDDLEYVLAHGSVADRYVFEAASWALAAHRLADKRRDLWMEPLPAVELADRLRTIPLFDFISVDELFRVAGTGRQVRHPGAASSITRGLRRMTCSSCSRVRCAFLAETTRRVTSTRQPCSRSRRCSKAARSATRSVRSTAPSASRSAPTTS